MAKDGDGMAILRRVALHIPAGSPVRDRVGEVLRRSVNAGVHLGVFVVLRVNARGESLADVLELVSVQLVVSGLAGESDADDGTTRPFEQDHIARAYSVKGGAAMDPKATLHGLPAIEYRREERLDENP